MTGPLPLRWLFLDLNAYFASVEQAEDASLLGKPVAVVPTPGDSATIIAASYEAKPHGVRTGTRVAEAKKLCPNLHLVPARPALYVHYHHQIIAAVETTLPVHKICSIDELKCRLIGQECDPAQATALARQIKTAIKDQVAPNLTCSIGIATNSFLAKLATEFQKPDGLVIIHHQDLPDKLKGLKLTDFPGINRRMQARLQAAGIFTSDDILARSAPELVRAFGSIVGERWWHLLRGHDLEFEYESGKSLGHSHVLPPDLRNDAASLDVIKRLLHKACARLRANGHWATRVSFAVSGRRKSWQAETRLSPTQDPLYVSEHLARLWAERDFSQPVKVSVTFTGLQTSHTYTPSLFEDQAPTDRAALSAAVDQVNQKFGKNAIFLAALHQTKDTASEKIAFNKTWLFSEGKNDHQWVNTRNPQSTKPKTKD